MDDAEITVINPTTITDAMFLSSNISETQYAEWNSGTTYNAGDYVQRGTLHRIYRAITGSNLNFAPEVHTKDFFPSAPKWQLIGATNKWAAFDTFLGTKSLANGVWEGVIAPGISGSLAIIGAVGSKLEIFVNQGVGGPLLYSFETSLIEACAPNWEAFFFDDVEYIEDYVLFDLPRIVNPVITYRITGVGMVGCSALVVGTKTSLGTTQWGVTVEGKDWSTYKTDEFGNRETILRDVVKRMEGQAEILNGEVNRVANKYNKLRGKQLVWVAAGNLYRAMIIYGYCERSSIDVQYITHSMCSFSIESSV